MVLISIRPFALWRALALGAALLGLSLATSFAQPVLLSVSYTPYDHQMQRIQPVLGGAIETPPQHLNLAQVNSWIRELRRIPYGYSLQWKTPYEVATDPVADCKGKSVTLYQLMRAHGARDVKLVIGKRSAFSRMTHTWVEWTTPSGVYVLDPTINRSACTLSALDDQSYVPYYAYAGGHKYRAVTPVGLFAGL